MLFFAITMSLMLGYVVIIPELKARRQNRKAIFAGS